jgi:hypothetical protein
MSVPAELEFEQYIHSYGAASRRVRWIVIILTMALLLILNGWWSLRDNGWFKARAFNFPDQISATGAPIEVLPNLDPDAAQRWRKASGGVSAHRSLSDLSAAQLKVVHDEYLRQMVRHAIVMTVPVLGLHFDVNDLGVIGGLSLSLLMLLLYISIARETELLFLSLWRVEQLASDKNQDRGDSSANFLYHSLAMEQVLSRPPTLARWHWRGWTSHAWTRALFFLPFAVHLVVVVHNLRTLPRSAALHTTWYTRGMKLQVVWAVVLLALGFICSRYAVANQQRWAKSFRRVNPRRSYSPQPGWWEWLRVRRPTRPWQQKGLMLPKEEALAVVKGDVRFLRRAIHLPDGERLLICYPAEKPKCEVVGSAVATTRGAGVAFTSPREIEGQPALGSGAPPKLAIRHGEALWFYPCPPLDEVRKLLD